MKFYEFGKENEKTLMMLHGNASTWKMSFGKCITCGSSSMNGAGLFRRCEKME